MTITEKLFHKKYKPYAIKLKEKDNIQQTNSPTPPQVLPLSAPSYYI